MNDKLAAMDGFLGTDAPLVLDLIVVVLALAIPLLVFSIGAASRGAHRVHKAIQITLTVVLAIALIGFELQVQQSGWEEMTNFAAQPPSRQNHLTFALGVHLLFAISTPFLWIAAMSATDRGRSHRVLGRLAAADLCLTALTGWYWYYVAFVSR